MIYLKSIEFKEDINPIKTGFKIEFNSNITLLVGDNGVGKSTITDAIGQAFGEKDDSYLKRVNPNALIINKVEEKFPLKFLDFHSHDKKFSGAFGEDIALQMYHMKASSGQVSMSIFLNSKLKDFKNGLIILDEPERGLSIRNQWGIGNFILKSVELRNCQIILTCHSEIILKLLKNDAEFIQIPTGNKISFEKFMIEQLK